MVPKLSVKDMADARFELAYGRTPHLLHTRESVASMLNLGERTIHRLVADGDLPCHRIGTRVLFSQSCIDILLTQHGVPMSYVFGDADLLLYRVVRKTLAMPGTWYPVN